MRECPSFLVGLLVCSISLVLVVGIVWLMLGPETMTITL